MIDSVNGIIERYGRAFTIIRKSAAAPPAQEWNARVTAGPDVSIKEYIKVVGRQRFYKPSEIVGPIKERDVLIVLRTDADVREGDLIAVGTFDATNDSTGVWRRVMNVYATQIDDLSGPKRVQARA